MIESVDILTAEATLKSDHEMICASVGRSVGVPAFNETIRSKLRNLLLLTATKRRDHAQDLGGSGKQKRGTVMPAEAVLMKAKGIVKT